MHDQGIAWMIAGGVRAESAEDQRQKMHRLAIAHGTDPRSDTMARIRERIAAVVGARPARTDNGTLAADCCPA